MVVSRGLPVIKIVHSRCWEDLPIPWEPCWNSVVFFLLQSQRRVTFHLPDGSQESCSDSGLGDHEPSSNTSMTHPLPLGFPQEEYYEQTSPNSRTEGDGNSDPESSKLIVFGHICFETTPGKRAWLEKDLRQEK